MRSLATPIKPPPARKILPVQKRALELDYSPYLDDGSLWDEGVDLFYAWLRKHFPITKWAPEYAVAELLNVHRCISDMWLGGAEEKGLVEFKRHSPFGPLGHEMYLFRIRPHLFDADVNVRVSDELRKFDPWNNRDHDFDVNGAAYPDLYYDKFYDVMVDERFLLTRSTTVLSNGHEFEAVSVSDIPRYADRVRLEPGDHIPEEWRAKLRKAYVGAEA